jgi:membrane-associated phospholipid phosphatase
MPLAGAPGESRSLADAVVPLLDASFHPAGVAVAQVVTLPGQVLISLALVLAASRKLWLQGRVEAAVAWPAAWLLASAVELVFRHTLTRPNLYRDGVHLVGFDTSWPSGHTLRAALVACALASAWPRLRLPLAVWFVAVVVLLEAAGFHTVTDVVGGLLLATVAAACAVVFEESGLLRARARD